MSIGSRDHTTRRSILKRAAFSLTAAARAALPGGAFARGGAPEVKGAKLGFIALTDAASLVIAKEKGLLAKFGMPDTEVLEFLYARHARPALAA